jgi:hypothetical protein
MPERPRSEGWRSEGWQSEHRTEPNCHSQCNADLPRHKSRLLSNIHPAETFPLIISAAIAVQGVIFLGVQGSGLGGLRAVNCQAISQVVWPGLSYYVPIRDGTG